MNISELKKTEDNVDNYMYCQGVSITTIIGKDSIVITIESL